VSSPGSVVGEAAAAQLTVATNARAAQLAISAATMRDASRLWPLLDKKRIEATFPGWLRAMSMLIRGYHGQSSQAAGSAYRAARQHATQSPAPRSLIHVAPPPPDEWLQKALGFAGPGQLGKDLARPNTALTTVLGTASRIVLDGGRTTTIETVHHDPVAVGWYRKTSPDPCYFCAMLASRGAVYKSERAAAFEAHNTCHCLPAPAFTRDHALPDINREAQRIYRESTRGVNTGEQIKAFRKAWDARIKPAE
jgi:hypothetical protein